MLAAALITLREGLEAALIVGIVLGVLRKLDRADRSRSVWAGVLAAVAVSVVAGLALNALGVAFEGRGEEIFEGVAMLLAAGVLTWMIFWMQRQGRQIQAELEFDVRQATAAGSAWALFSLAFVAVVREGIEDVRAFFRVTSVLLIFFAAGLVAHGVHELQEAALLPTFVERVWDVNHILDERGALGTFLNALFGYNGNPSLIEVFSYLGYLFAVYLVTRLSGRRRIVSALSG